MEQVVAECPFDGGFPGPGWTVIRGEAGGWSASGGVLFLPTLPGGIWNSEMAQAKNMFVRDLPGWDQKAAPLAAEARVRMVPESWGEQAGIWLYAADDHWVKLVVERKKDGSTKVCFASRSPGKPAASVANQELPSSASKPGEDGGVSLRIEVSKDRSEVAGLVNCGYCIRLVGKLGISLPSGTRVGVMAHGGDAEDSPRMAAFDQMRLLAIAPDRVQFAGKQEETPVAAQAAAAAATSAAGAAAVDGGGGLVQTPSGWTLSSNMSAEKMAQVMSLIGETAGGGEGAGAAPYVVLRPGGDGHAPTAGGDVDASEPFKVGGWTLSPDLGPEQLAQVLQMVGQDASGGGGGQQPYIQLEGGGDKSGDEALRSFFETKLRATLGANAPTRAEIEEKCMDEVQGLHQFMEGWFSGRIARTDGEFKRFMDVTHRDYHIITATGDVKDREGLIRLLDMSHACMSDHGDYKISIKNPRLRTVTPGNPPGYLVTYEEWNSIDGADTGRICSVLFGASVDPDCPNGLVWMHSHETSLP